MTTPDCTKHSSLQHVTEGSGNLSEATSAVVALHACPLWSHKVVPAGICDLEAALHLIAGYCERAQMLHVMLGSRTTTFQGIHVTAYSPLGSPDSAEMMKRAHKEPLMQSPKVKEIAAKHNKAAAEVTAP